MIRVESEETQDYVCGMLAISREEAEELAFVPIVLSEPRGSIYFCDNRCSEKATRYWQMASMVVEEGAEAHTSNLCHNEQMVQQGTPRLNAWQWRAVVEQRAHRGRMWKIVGKEPFLMDCGSTSLSKMAGATKIPEDPARERQEGIQGQWQQESPFREYLEQVRGHVEKGCGAQMMRKIFSQLGEESRKGCREKEESSEWTLEKIREACEKVAREEVGRLGIVQEILRKVRTSWGGSLRQSVEREESPCRTSARNATVSPWRTASGGIDGTRRRQQQDEEALQLVVRGVWRQM